MNKMTGQGCPSNKLQGAIGQFYENTNNGDIYECQSILKDCNGVSCCNWVLRASGEHIDDHAEIFGSGGGLPPVSEPTIEAVVPETSFENANNKPSVPIDFSNVDREGLEYIVVWNGVEYVCELTQAKSGDVWYWVLGNPTISLTDDEWSNTVHPFELSIPCDNPTIAYIAAKDAESPFTISIHKRHENASAISADYLPGPIYLAGDHVQRPDQEYIEAVAYADKDRTIPLTYAEGSKRLWQGCGIVFFASWVTKDIMFHISNCVNYANQQYSVVELLQYTGSDIVARSIQINYSDSVPMPSEE